MKYTFILLLSSLLFLPVISGQIACINVIPSSTTIGIISSYNFTIDRTTSSVGLPVSITDISSGSSISILFPPQYNSSIISSYTCQSVSIQVTGESTTSLCTPSSCLLTGRNLTISGCIQSSLNIKKVYVTVGNIINPIPVITLSSFIGYVGNDFTSQAPLSGKNPYFILTPNTMNCNITFNPTTIYSNSSMIVSITPKNTIPIGSTNLMIQFPLTGYWTNDPSNKSIISLNPNCVNLSGLTSSACTRSSNSLIYTTLGASAPISGAFSYSISYIWSPPSPQQIDNVIITSLSSGNPLDRCTVPIIQLTSQTILVGMSAYNGSNISAIVNQQVQLLITPTFTIPIITSSDWKFQLIFPSGSRFSFSNVILYSNQFISFNSNSTTAQWTLSNTYTNTLSGLNSLLFYNYTAPYSTLTTGDIVLNIIKNNYIIMTGLNKLTASPGALTANISFDPKSINQLSSYTFSIQILNPLSNSGCIQIILPSALSHQGPTLCSANGIGINSLPVCTGNTTTVRICSLSNSPSNITPQTINLTISNIKNPNSVRLSNIFKISTYYVNDTINLVDTGTSIGITPISGVLDINLIKIIPSVSTTYASSVSYKISFTNLNPIPQSGTVLIAFPNTITFTNNPVCTANVNGNNFTTMCTKITIDSKNYFNFTNLLSSSALTGGSNITLQFSNVFTNQPTTQNSSSFGIKTFDNLNYLIDELMTGIFPLITASSSVVTILQGNTTNSVITSYRFTINQPPPLMTGSKVVIIFPSSIIPQQGLTCVDSLGASLLSCQVSGLTVTTSLLSNASNLNFVIILSSVKNAPSLRQSDSFLITTLSSTNYLYSSNQLQKVTNKQASLMSSLSGVFDPSTFATATVFTIKATPSSQATSILITLSQSLQINSVTCSPPCSSNGRNLTLIGSFSGETTITISGITTPLPFSNDRTSVATYQSTYLIDNNVDYIQFATNCTFPCRTCSIGNSSSCSSCYSLDVMEYIYYNSVNRQCVKQCSSGYFINGTNCSACASLPCATCSGTATNCTSCSSSSHYPYFNQSGSSGTCLSSCSTGMYPDSSTSITKCVQCVGKCLTCSNSTFCLSCVEGSFLYNNQCLLQCPTNKSFITNTALKTCDPCEPNCVTCQNLTTSCLSCPITGGYVLYLSKCIITCPYPMIKFQGTCVNCHPSCETCSLLPNNCSSCSTGYLFNNRCLSVCTSGYTGINNVCQICQPNCKTCSNSTQICTSCNVPDFYIPTLNTCSATCPTNLFKNLETQQCVLCSSPCYTCIDLYTNCQTCLSGFIMFNNQCIIQCPSGTVTNGTHCIQSSGNQQIDKTLSSKIFPMPFTISGTIIAITAGISKFQNSNTFFSGATFSLLGLIQWGAYLAFLLIYAFQIGQINTFLIVLIAIFAIIYILNIVAFVTYFCILYKDTSFKIWKQKKCSNNVMLIFAHILSFIISFKFMNIIFCKLYDFSIFKAKLDSVRKFFGFNFLIFLSTPFSLGAIGVAAYYAYTNYSNIITQLYLQAIDLIIVVLFTFIFGIATSHKQQQFFEQKVGETIIGKKGYDNDQIIDSKQPLRPQILSQFSKNLISNQNSLMQLKNDMSNGEFQEQDFTGLQSVNSPIKKNQKYLSSQSKNQQHKFNLQNMVHQKKQKIQEQEQQSIQQNKEQSDELDKEHNSDKQQSQILKQQKLQKDITKSLQQQSILNEMKQNNNTPIIPISQQTKINKQQQDILVFQERDKDTSRDQQNLNLSKQEVIKQDQRLASQNNQSEQQTDNQNNKIKNQQRKNKNNFQSDNVNLIFQENDHQIDEDKFSNVIEQEEPQQLQASLQLQGSDELSKRGKATVKTKGLDTDKDNYITDKGDICGKQIFSDQQSDFKFGNNKDPQNNKHYSEGEKASNRILQLDQQNDRIIPSFENVYQIDDSLPEEQLSIELRPYHAIPLNRRGQRLHQNKTIDVERNNMLNDFYKTSQMFRNKSNNKIMPVQQQDHKVTDLSPSPNLQQAEGGHKIINKDPPKDPMKSFKKQKKNRNELLNSSSEFQASESQNQINRFEKIQQLRRQNLTELSKQQQSKKNKKQQPQPKKIKIVYDTSDIMDEDSMQFQQIGVSPSDFNHYNQRFVQQQFNFKASSNPLSKNDVPLKPQIVMVKSKDKIIGKPQGYQNYQQDDQSIFNSYGNDEPQIGKVIFKSGNKPMSAVQRQPIMLRGFSSQGQRSNHTSTFFNSTSRDKRPAPIQNYSQQKKPQKVNRGLQKIYLQRLDGPSNNKQK